MDELSKIKKENIFKVPDDYFNEFPARLQQRIIKGRDPGEKRKIITLLRPYISYAASIVGFLLIAYSIYYYLQPDNSFITLTEEEIYEEIAWNSFEIDENLLVDVLINDTDYGLSNGNDETDEIIDYLLDEVVEFDIFEEGL